VHSPKCIPAGPDFNLPMFDVGSRWELKVTQRREEKGRNVPLCVGRYPRNCSASKPPHSFLLPRSRQMYHTRMNSCYLTAQPPQITVLIGVLPTMGSHCAATA